MKQDYSKAFDTRPVEYNGWMAAFRFSRGTQTGTGTENNCTWPSSTTPDAGTLLTGVQTSDSFSPVVVTGQKKLSY